MGGLEPETTPHKFFDAADLVNSIAKAGPGASLSVRIRSKDGKRIIGVGRTSWNDDRSPGGPVVIFPNPENKKEEWLIPLGGGTFYDTPPRINSLMRARTVGVPFGEVRAHERSIDPIAEGYSFELVSKKRDAQEFGAPL
ncbi:MAG: hypothetical protein A2756_04260 [Candidatus Ryanbacteria bacterium RIFCSPHIGHO2_01_FULL_48_27]|uniref:Uncharacterized protein n=2 Tax=Parcubacteria group TaxID=1794811 RepID=A0A1G1YQE0_9BACT|nr:MAG: hypothetical protein A3A24_02310 [Candidatus Buchananbacteria bacterium RIFCSPLOWO2_01_FULL_46_12]OGZ44437.1 MAG: hypothetical protein A2756_04260 [Candidatus Ryanbacteria bacterium RIFCSPHIGHO2_01_FULL_48_27]